MYLFHLIHWVMLSYGFYPWFWHFVSLILNYISHSSWSCSFCLYIELALIKIICFTSYHYTILLIPLSVFQSLTIILYISFIPSCGWLYTYVVLPLIHYSFRWYSSSHTFGHPYHRAFMRSIILEFLYLLHCVC